MAEHRSDKTLISSSEPEERDTLRIITLLLLGAMVIVVAGLCWFLVAFVQGQRETAECYQSAFDELNGSLAVSREAARLDRANLRTLVAAILDPGVTDTEVNAALDAYAAALDAADRDRAAAPLPNRICG